MAIRIFYFLNILYIITIILQCRRIDRPVRSPKMMQGGPAVPLRPVRRLTVMRAPNSPTGRPTERQHLSTIKKRRH